MTLSILGQNSKFQVRITLNFQTGSPTPLPQLVLLKKPLNITVFKSRKGQGQILDKGFINIWKASKPLPWKVHQMVHLRGK